MISQVSSVGFLVYTLLCVELWSTDSWQCNPKTGERLGDIRGVKISLSLQCKWQFARSGQLSELHIFSPFQMLPPPQCGPGRMLPFAPPAATEASFLLAISAFDHKKQACVSHECMISVPCLVTLRPLCKIFLATPGADPEFLVSDTGRIKNFLLAQNCAFWSSLTLRDDYTVQNLF